MRVRGATEWVREGFAMCRRKRAYTRKEALAAVATLAVHVRLSIYRCERGRHWHVTHRPWSTAKVLARQRDAGGTT